MNCKDCDKEAIGFQEVSIIDPDTGKKIVTGGRNYNQCDECRKETYRQIELKKKAKRNAIRANYLLEQYESIDYEDKSYEREAKWSFALACQSILEGEVLTKEAGERLKAVVERAKEQGVEVNNT